ncbi:MAG: hypothetical protein A2491_14045 [Bacteroidetes bacterium RIFOXYC12_FULL_35_7]|nr:MAG: hypothetical protein A2491_14045 [Bacteroidetes bacterium RIFOXYC12_FULL_35_7]
MYKKFKITFILFVIACLQLSAQEATQNLTFQGFDVDTSKVNAPSFGIQVSNDANILNFPKGETFNPGLYNNSLYNSQIDKLKNISSSEYLANNLGWKSSFWIRTDLWVNVALPHKTNIYTLIALRAMNMDSGSPDDFSYTLLNMEVEHYFDKHFKVRFGRLINKLSASQFYGRIALGASDAHVFGRTPFVCDALEFDMNFKDKGLPVFMVGVKPQFNEFDFNTFYLGAHTNLSPLFRTYLLYSLNKQQVADLTPYFPYLKNERYYVAIEAEFAFDNKTVVSFINIGTNMNYIGPALHYSGARDILKRNEPLIIAPNSSIKETLLPSAGVAVRPCLLTPKLSFFKRAGLECEINGLLDSRIKSYNAYLNLKFEFFKNLNFEYGYNLNITNYNQNNTFYVSGKPVLYTDKLSYGVNYLRLCVIFGKPSRQM